MAQELASWVEEHPDFELAAPHPFSLVCFRHIGGDAVNERIVDEINSSGKAYLTHAVIDGAYTIRVAVGSPTTRSEDVAALWKMIQEGAG